MYTDNSEVSVKSRPETDWVEPVVSYCLVKIIDEVVSTFHDQIASSAKTDSTNESLAFLSLY